MEKFLMSLHYAFTLVYPLISSFVKFILVLLSVTVIPMSAMAQQVQLDVEGDAQIRGYIDVHHPVDSSSIYIGLNAGLNATHTTDQDNVFLGTNAGASNTIGTSNIFIGRGAGKFNTEGIKNVFIGRQAGNDNTTGNSNIFIGASVGRDNTTGAQNVMIGEANGLFNSTGSDNTMMGWAAGLGLFDGSDNTFIGHYAGGNISAGSFNTYLGKNSGLTSNMGTRNTYLGHSADTESGLPSDSLDRSIAIGYNAKVACSNCAVIGGTGIDAVKVGIGTSEPTHSLQVEGESRFAGPMDLSQGMDATSILLGEDAGLNGDFTSNRNNTFLGYQSGSANTTSQANTYIGSQAGTSATGPSNTMIGSAAGIMTSSGGDNTFVGATAGLFNQDGTQNVFIGSGAGSPVSQSSLDNAIAIGYNASVECSDCAVLGNADTNFGLGTSTPEAMIHVEGDATVSRPHFIARDSDSDGFTRMRFTNTNVDDNYWTLGGQALLDGSESLANITFFYRSNGSTDPILEVFGDGNATLAGMLTENSDRRLKTNIIALSGILPKLKQLSAYSYHWKNSQSAKYSQIGLMAQEVKSLFPELVLEDEYGMLSVSYSRFVPLLIQGIKEQEAQIESQNQELQVLKENNKALMERVERLEQILLKK